MMCVQCNYHPMIDLGYERVKFLEKTLNVKFDYKEIVSLIKVMEDHE